MCIYSALQISFFRFYPSFTALFVICMRPKKMIFANYRGLNQIRTKLKHLTMAPYYFVLLVGK